MKMMFMGFLMFGMQTGMVVSKNNGGEEVYKSFKMYQSNDASGVARKLTYSYRGKPGKIDFAEIKRVSFKELLKRKKGVATFRVILVKRDNSKLEVAIDLWKLEGTTAKGKTQTIALSAIDKVSF